MIKLEELKHKIISGLAVAFTDSRQQFSKDDVFVALIGEHHDAAKFVPELIANGLSFAVVQDRASTRELLKKCPVTKLIYVPDTIIFLQELAKQKLNVWREQNNERKVFALTGSNGKTTTKEMLSWLLGAYKGKVHTTKGNLNNHLGVPYTILEMPLETDILLLEMGTNHPGEIARLCEIASPHAGLITNIGQSHLEFFHNEDNVMMEKSQLYHSIATWSDGTFIVNDDDPRLTQLKNKPHTLSFGKKRDNDYIFKATENGFLLNFKERQLVIKCPLIPESHNRHNMALAMSLCLSQWSQSDFIDDLVMKAESYKAPRNNRSMFLSFPDLEVYLDAYNANPSSMTVSLDGFKQWWTQQKNGRIEEAWFILGDMNELGEKAKEYHRQLGAKLLELGAQKAFFIGRYAADYAEGFKGGEVFSDRHNFLSKIGLGPATWNAPAVFIKGSRTLQLEELVDITVLPAL